MSTLTARHFAAVTVCTLAAGALVAAPVVGAQSSGSANADSANGHTVTLLNITDYHGRISDEGPSTVAFADTIEKLRADAGADSSLLLSAGDNVGATLFSSSFKQDQPTIDVLNAIGLDSSAVGNHEFDKGIADLQDRIIPAAEWDYLGANVTVDGSPMQEYSLHEVSGLTVGVIGVVTEETPTLVSPGGMTGVEFSDPVEAVNRVAAQLSDGDDSNGEADIIVAEYHEGAPSSAGSIEVARAQSEVFDDIVTNTAGTVDAIFTGHSHIDYAWEGEKAVAGAEQPGLASSVAGLSDSAGPYLGGSLGSLTNSVGGAQAELVATRPVLQAGSYGDLIGRVVLEVDPGTGDVTGHTQENVEVPGEATDADLNNAVVSEVKKIVDETLAEAEVVGSEPVGTVTADITTAHSGGERDDRLSESTLGNLVGQFLVEAVEERGGADIGFMNPGGLRDELRNDPAGENGNITLAEANGVLPFANTLVTLDLSDLDLTSLGAPTTGAVDVTLGGADLGTFTAVSGVDNTTFGPAGHHTPLDGHVVIDVTIPAGTPAGETALIVTTDTGTVITVPVTVA